MMTKEKRIPTLQLVLCAVFAALTAVCAQITIPIGAVPISLSLLPPLLCAALLSPRYAVLSMAVYLLMGLCGLPVFSGMSGGPGKLFGVTGGYIIGFIAIEECRQRRLVRTGINHRRVLVELIGEHLVIRQISRQGIGVRGGQIRSEAVES